MGDEFEITRTDMVRKLRDHYKIKNETVLDVMRTVPRHFFVPDALKFQAYKDNALPISGNQTISQPFMVARMTELLELVPSSRVLEIGAGSGYQSAVLAKIARTVYAVERVPILANKAAERLSALGLKNVSVKCDDGTLGWEVYAPFDAILVAAGGPVVPEPLIKQLRVGGRLVIPIGSDAKTQELVRATRTEQGYTIEKFGPCAFVPLIGAHGWQN
jgi:protein-L-isoaspartate(D-aspartate) O-methyltransferase